MARGSQDWGGVMMMMTPPHIYYSSKYEESVKAPFIFSFIFTQTLVV